jgi:predicted secreted protein
MSGYTNPFGGGVIKPSDVGFRELALTVLVTQLAWPGYAIDDTEQSANKIDITSSIASAVVTMPPANVVSPGESIIFTNLSANTITVKSTGGTTIGTIAASASRLVYLTDNSTEAGVWRTVLYGVGTGSVDIAAAAGYGLEASGATLQSDMPTASVADATIIDGTYRAQLLGPASGATNLKLGFASVLGAGFWCAVRNTGASTYSILVSVGDSIDGGGAGVGTSLQPGESCFVVSNGGSAWFTIGRGRSQAFNFTRLSKAVVAGTNTLTSTEAANIIQSYTGAPGSNATVVVPSVVQVYYATNNTTGGFTVTIQTAVPGGAVTLAAGESAVVVCDGVNVINMTTVLTGGATSNFYSPGITGVANIGSLSAASPWFYTRVGNVVRVSGQFTGTPTAATTATKVAFSLPIASNLAATGDLAGTGRQITSANGEAVGIYADTANDRAEAFFQSLLNTASVYSIEFSYVVK